MATQTTPAEVIRGWMAEGRHIKTAYLGEQGGLFGGADRMIEVKHGRAVAVISEVEFAHIAESYNLGQPEDAPLVGLQAPLMFSGAFNLQGDSE